MLSLAVWICLLSVLMFWCCSALKASKCTQYSLALTKQELKLLICYIFTIGLAIKRWWVQFEVVPLRVMTLASSLHVLSPSSIIWYCQDGVDALWWEVNMGYNHASQTETWRYTHQCTQWPWMGRWVPHRTELGNMTHFTFYLQWLSTVDTCPRVLYNKFVRFFIDAVPCL